MQGCGITTLSPNGERRRRIATYPTRVDSLVIIFRRIVQLWYIPANKADREQLPYTEFLRFLAMTTLE